MKVDQGPLFNIHSPLSWPTVLTTSPILIIFMSLSFCLMSGNSFPTGDETTRKVTILLDLLKSVKQLEFQLMYELLPYCSISLWLKNRHSSSRIFNITNSNNLSKNVALWPHIRTLGSEYTWKKKNSCSFDKQFVLSHTSRTLRINMLMLPWLFYNCSFRWD